MHADVRNLGAAKSAALRDMARAHHGAASGSDDASRHRYKSDLGKMASVEMTIGVLYKATTPTGVNKAGKSKTNELNS